LLQQVDIATPPERALKPRRGVIIGVGIGLTFLVAFVVSILLFLVKGRPETESWRQVKTAWGS